MSDARSWGQTQANPQLSLGSQQMISASRAKRSGSLCGMDGCGGPPQGHG
jgi:hypothetical protein